MLRLQSSPIRKAAQRSGTGLRSGIAMPRRTARLPVLATLCSLCFTLASAYIPATPTNDTGVLRNETDFVQINWLPMGVSAYKDALSRQLIDVRPEGVAGYRVRIV